MHELRKIQRKLYPRDFFWGVQAACSMELSVLWNTLSGLILIKEGMICNTDWRLVISFLPDILWVEGVSVRGSGTTKIIIIIIYYYYIMRVIPKSTSDWLVKKIWNREQNFIIWNSYIHICITSPHSCHPHLGTCHTVAQAFAVPRHRTVPPSYAARFWCHPWALRWCENVG